MDGARSEAPRGPSGQGGPRKLDFTARAQQDFEKIWVQLAGTLTTARHVAGQCGSHLSVDGLRGVLVTGT